MAKSAVTIVVPKRMREEARGAKQKARRGVGEVKAAIYTPLLNKKQLNKKREAEAEQVTSIS